jgi:hypothetical protein
MTESAGATYYAYCGLMGKPGVFDKRVASDGVLLPFRALADK